MADCAQTHSSSWFVYSPVRNGQLLPDSQRFRVWLVCWEHGSLCADSQHFLVCTMSGEIMAVCAQTHGTSWSVTCLVSSRKFVCRLTAVSRIYFSGENMAAWRRFTAVGGLNFVRCDHGSYCADSQQFMVCTLSGENMAVCVQNYSRSWCVPSLVRTWQLARRLTAVRDLCLVWWDHGSLCADSQQLLVYTLYGRT
jgi:hypothetical protein